MCRVHPSYVPFYVPSYVPYVLSHSPKELTSWEDCARGAGVLLGAVLEMDRA
jgi:hypothetical protein